MEQSSSLALNLLKTPMSTEPSTMKDSRQLRPADVWVLCLFTFGPAAITILYSIYQCFHPISHNNERTMNILPVTLSLIASFLSANTIVGLPATITKEGLTFGWIIFTFPISMFLVSYFFVPVTYNLKVVDIFMVSLNFLFFILIQIIFNLDYDNEYWYYFFSLYLLNFFFLVSHKGMKMRWRKHIFRWFYL